MNTKNARLGFWGTPDFAVPALQRLIDEGYFFPHIVTQPDKPVGRKHLLTASPVKQLAQQYHIPVFQPATLKDDRFFEWLKKEHLDVVIVVAYGKIIPERLLSVPRLGMVNIHGSLLPLLRGASPIQAAIVQGFTKTGITIQKVATKMDEGDVFVQQTVSIADRETAETLHDKLSQAAADLLSKNLPAILSGELRAAPQQHAQATYTKKLSREDGEIDWSKSATALDHFIRGMYPWPGAWTEINGKRLHVHEALLEKRSAEGKPGTFIVDNENLFALCTDGVLKILSLTLEGEKRQTAQDFIHGHASLLEEKNTPKNISEALKK